MSMFESLKAQARRCWSARPHASLAVADSLAAQPAAGCAAALVAPLLEVGELRCRYCGVPRRTTPQHKPDCPKAWQNCPGCVNSDASGEAAHLASCPRAALADMQRVRGEVSDDLWRELAREERERLMAQLIFAARELARRNIVGSLAGHRGVPVCSECRIVERVGRLPHTAVCATGRVLGLIESLCELAVEEPGSDLTAKEENAAWGMEGAGARDRTVAKAVVGEMLEGGAR